ncbi:type III secretion system inner rod subunit SctI [Marivita sp. GX14005]|uniref:type III secretion system inner rod subunit SctI n=1 Tax=Marivita sp. GX14005 TaxID=2942276 RepID=UPI00201888B5|nr:type III secretion system inner rod subunit SctI [Marivita sp. GX14005]MCL3883302.1 type III secretion system inner rod subunit SctI [Marivita sp. GX14005]
MSHSVYLPPSVGQGGLADAAGSAGAAPQAPGGSSLRAFANAMDAASGAHGPAQITPVQFVPGAEAAQAPSGVQSASPAAASDEAVRQRAIDGLELDAPVAGAAGAAAEGGIGTGQTILDGLARIRGAFDGGLERVNSKVAATDLDVSDMMGLQMEVVQYSMMVDVSSKLAGKSTQAMDTLMKAQ